jgi:PhoPQ-activated pathogenicity-related protein
MSFGNSNKRHSMVQFITSSRKQSMMPFLDTLKRQSLIPFVSNLRRQSIMVVKREPKRSSLLWNRKSTEGTHTYIGIFSIDVKITKSKGLKSNENSIFKTRFFSLNNNLKR